MARDNRAEEDLLSMLSVLVTPDEMTAVGINGSVARHLDVVESDLDVD